jgi:hypothetical protein
VHRCASQNAFAALACVWAKRKMYFAFYSHECTHGVTGLARPCLLRSGDPPKLSDDLLLGSVNMLVVHAMHVPTSCKHFWNLAAGPLPQLET